MFEYIQIPAVRWLSELFYSTARYRATIQNKYLFPILFWIKSFDLKKFSRDRVTKTEFFPPHERCAGGAAGAVFSHLHCKHLKKS